MKSPLSNALERVPSKKKQTIEASTMPYRYRGIMTHRMGQCKKSPVIGWVKKTLGVRAYMKGLKSDRISGIPKTNAVFLNSALR